MFFCQGAKAIVTNAYKKQGDKIPVKEKQKAINARKDYINRCNEGIYYEQEH
jgi:hypothetical protein